MGSEPDSRHNPMAQGHDDTDCKENTTLNTTLASIKTSSLATKTDLYQPLEKAKKEIRVLHLLPGSKDAPVHCRLETVALATAPGKQEPIFDALSYTWGSSKENRTVSVESGSRRHVVSVTDNLYHALRNIRPRRSRALVIWVDAICINQSDDTEKSWQVAQMGEVYSQARIVRVWLGMPDSHLHGRLQYSWRVFRRAWRAVLFRSRFRSSLVYPLYPELFTAKLRMADSALACTEHKWHERAWVCQEFLLAKEVVFHSGRSTLSRPADIAHDLRLWDIEQLILTTMERWSNLRPTSRSETLDLLQASVLTAGTDASDPRDKVYSLLGLLQNRAALNIIPDYSLSVWETYAKATFAHIISSRNLLSLELIDHQRARAASLPTWTVDFSSIPAMDRYGSNHFCFLSSVSPILEEYNPTLDVESRKLSFSGNTFAKIAAVRTLASTSTNAGHCMNQDETEHFIDQYESLLLSHFQPFDRTSMKWARQDISGGAKSLTSRMLLECFASHWAAHCSSRAQQQPEPERWHKPHTYLRRLRDFRISERLAICTTDNGYFGTVSDTCQPGDIVVYAPGAHTPLLLRPEADCWHFVGMACIHRPDLPGVDDKDHVWKCVETLLMERFTIC